MDSNIVYDPLQLNDITNSLIRSLLPILGQHLEYQDFGNEPLIYFEDLLGFINDLLQGGSVASLIPEDYPNLVAFLEPVPMPENVQWRAPAGA